MDGLFAIASYVDPNTQTEANECLKALSVAYHPKMELECEDTSKPFKFLCSQVRSNNRELNVSYYNRKT